MDVFSPAQCLGYVALVLGIAAFLQKKDRRLKVLISSEGFVYTAHFAMLGNFAASSSAMLSGVRTLLSIKSQAVWLASVIIAINLALGFAFSKSAVEWLPVIASCAATIAMFYMQGIPMRLVLLVCTLMWLVNNFLSHSIGGTVLEAGIAVVNATTIIRMFRAQAAESLAPPAGGLQTEA